MGFVHYQKGYHEFKYMYIVKHMKRGFLHLLHKTGRDIMIIFKDWV